MRGSWVPMSDSNNFRGHRTRINDHRRGWYKSNGLPRTSAECEDPWMTDDPWTNARSDHLPKNGGNAWAHWNSCTTSNRAPAQFANIDLDEKTERLAMLEEDNYARER